MKPAGKPVQAGGAAAAASVAGATGGGSTATMPGSAVGVGDLSGILKQLTDAVALLSQAIQSMGGTVGGGGPIQVPPTKLPPTSGSGHAGTRVLQQRIDAALARTDVSNEAKAKLSLISNTVAKLIRQEDATGTSDAAIQIEIGASTDRALLPAGDPRIAQLDQLMVELRAAQATALTVGSYNQIDIQRLSQEHDVIMKSGPAPIA